MDGSREMNGFFASCMIVCLIDDRIHSLFIWCEILCSNQVHYSAQVHTLCGEIRPYVKRGWYFQTLYIQNAPDKTRRCCVACHDGRPVHSENYRRAGFQILCSETHRLWFKSSGWTWGRKWNNCNEYDVTFEVWELKKPNLLANFSVPQHRAPLHKEISQWNILVIPEMSTTPSKTKFLNGSHLDAYLLKKRLYASIPSVKAKCQLVCSDW